MHGKNGWGNAIQLKMQPKHLRSYQIKQAEPTLKKITKLGHKEGAYIFVVPIQNQPTSLALWARALSHCTQVASSPYCHYGTANLS